MTSQTAGIILQGATLLYCLSTVGYILFLFKQKLRVQRVAFRIMTTAIVLHLISIIVYTIQSGHPPIQNMAQNLSAAGFALGGMFLYFQHRFDLKIMGVFASGLVSVFMLVAWLIPDAPVVANESLKSVFVYAHIILVFMGDASLALACGGGILYLLQEKGIKTKTPGFFFKRLPSLDLLDNVGYTCLTTGFALLSVGLMIGFIYAYAIWGRFWSWDVKEVFSVGAWLVYAAMLHLRLNSGWRGHKSAVMTIIGFVIVLFTFIGVNLLLGGHHQEFTKLK